MSFIDLLTLRWGFIGNAAKVIVVDENGDSVNNGFIGPEAEPGEGQTVVYTSAAVQSAAIIGSVVDIVVTSNAFIAIASNPTATVSSYYCVSDTTYRFSITTGNKVSVLRDAYDGEMHLHPVSN